MHELSICQATLKQILDIGQSYPNHVVSCITLKIGPLSGVEPFLLEQAFPLASINTIAENAELIIEHLPVKILCLQCDTESKTPPNRLLCQKCGAWQTKLISGDEMLLASLEFQELTIE
ncbi:hydrogenase maturation nickel metallochaperone HypA [Candidatus Halobeggiatoa sp. HSG11]|nr:hydrogenase maturation nickel metallochaperone HypA [Candidatus Halobeggiatoa sp. HSG11]